MERLCFVRFLCNSGCHDSCCPMFSSVNCFVWHCFSFTFWPLSCLSFFDLWLLITPLVSSNFSFFLVTYLDKSKTQNICKGRFIIFKKNQQSMYYLDTSSLDSDSSKRTSTRISELRDYNYSTWKVTMNKLKCRKGAPHR